MRWQDKPRKFKSEDIVKEYIRFMKIMKTYGKFIAKFYSSPSFYKDFWSGQYVPTIDYENSSKSLMIKYYTKRLMLYRRFDFYAMKNLFFHFIGYPCNYAEIELLWDYFKEKHMANCIIIQ